MSRRCLGCMELFGDEFQVCPTCGYVVGTPAEEAIHMEPGTVLHERYIVGKVLGYGGFGVTYIGWDIILEQKVAIKEYLPGEFSTRMPGQTQVTVFRGDKSQQFQDGLKKFVDEAKRLARFQNEPGIVKIFDSFAENDTAYIIMEYLDGETLTSYLAREGTIPEDTAVAMLMPIMQSLQVVHAEGLLHRDIAPDNIFLTKTGQVKLIDFGASRFATTSHSRSLTVIIKPGYSPEEQYRSRGDQGPYTDVYAIAATIYKMITGKTPPDSMERRAKYENKNKDILIEPRKLDHSISVTRDHAILNAMNVRIEDRTPDIETFIAELNAKTPAKRRSGKIKKIDVYAWPMWLKVLIPAALALTLALVVLLLTGVISFSPNYSSSIVVPENTVSVPDVENMDKDKAIQIIEEGSLLAVTGGSVQSEYIDAGIVVLQTPVGGTYIEKNGTVELVVSSGGEIIEAKDGIATVPYLIWDTKEDAIEKLLKAGFGQPIIKEVNDENVTAGMVVSTSIEAGEKVKEGTIITLFVSRGPESFDMINVVGYDVADAISALEAKGLVVSVEYASSTSVPAGEVIRQSASESAKLNRGDKVTITVSSGKDVKTVQVANVTGKSRSDAVSTLRNQGFEVSVLENYDANVSSGNVISQSPSAGSSQLEGSTVTIYVSKGPQTIPVESVSISSSQLTLAEGQSASLSASVYPYNATNTGVSWSSSNTSVASVSSNGRVTAVAAGTATVKATTADGGKTANCTVTVNPANISVTGVSLNRSSMSLKVGETATLTATVTPYDATDKRVIWSSSNTLVATVNNDGIVTANTAGTAIITATSKDGSYTNSCNVTVENLGLDASTLKVKYLNVSFSGSTMQVYTTLESNYIFDSSAISIINSQGKTVAISKLSFHPELYGITSPYECSGTYTYDAVEYTLNNFTNLDGVKEASDAPFTLIYRVIDISGQVAEKSISFYVP